jgi:hypothetical protein
MSKNPALRFPLQRCGLVISAALRLPAARYLITHESSAARAKILRLRPRMTGGKREGGRIPSCILENAGRRL